MTHRKSPPTIYPDQLIWEPQGSEDDPAARLHTHIRIAGTDMHLEAWEVQDEDDCQEATLDSLRRYDFGSLSDIMDCAFETTEINGRTYVLVATPYGR